MKPEAQQIAIAEACGYTINREPPYAGMAWKPGTPPHGMTVHTTFFMSLPDYLNDLNAMHEAEKVLDDGAVWKGYLNNLWAVVCPQFNQMNGLNAAVGLLLVHATAAHRAEAFLRTMGKWEES